MSLFALYQEAPRPVSREAVNDALAGNLCRCTGYRPIVDAALEACAASRDAFAARGRHRRAPRALADADDLFVGDADALLRRARERGFAAALYDAHPDATLVAGCTDVGLWVTKGCRRSTR